MNKQKYLDWLNEQIDSGRLSYTERLVYVAMVIKIEAGDFDEEGNE